MPSAAPAITIEGLGKRVGAVRALEDLSLIIGTGEVFRFLGPNGAGKTTTILLLLGLPSPSAGHATVLGRPVSRSATQREGETAVSWCAGILAGSYVLDYLARVWTAIAFLRPLSLFRYHEPQRVLRDGLVAGDILVLSAVGAVALAAAFAVFARRDL